MQTKYLTYKPLSAIRLTAIIVLIVGLVFPLLFAYINEEMTSEILLRELSITPLRLGGIAIIIYAIIQLTNKTIGLTKLNWLRYFIELPLSIYITFYWLVWFLQHVEALITHNGFYPTDNRNFRQYIGLFMVATIFIYIYQSGLNFYKRAQKKSAEAEKFEREYAQVRLQALKNQVNPHFLFNSLSVLSSLVHVSAETADLFIQQLSKAYRYILEQKELDTVTLKAELDFLEAYFFLLQIRFDKKIKLEKEITLEQQAYRLPPLTLQLLIENVVKHNKMSNNEPLTIKIYNDEEFLVVVNNINKRDQHESSTGIGLDNITKRYAFITDKKIEIHNSGNYFTVRIPLLKN